MPKPPVVDPEIKICGAHACQAVAARRPQDVRRVYLTEALLGEFGEFLKWCARQRIAYHVVGDDDLERLTQSVHHGGVAFIVRQPAPPSMPTLLRRLGADAPGTPRLLLYLDNVQNPHNLGAIVRVAAHFGADAILVAGEGAGLSTSMVRTAEGGAEFVDVLPVALGRGPLLALREAGFRLLATSSHAKRSLYGAEGLPPRIVVMLGSESHGLAPAVRGMADATIVIPGSGQVESLNVACAAAVILGEHWREHREGASTLPKGQDAQKDMSTEVVSHAPAAPAEGRAPRAADKAPAARGPRGGKGGAERPERPTRTRGPSAAAERPAKGAEADRRPTREDAPKGRQGAQGKGRDEAAKTRRPERDEPAKPRRSEREAGERAGAGRSSERASRPAVAKSPARRSEPSRDARNVAAKEASRGRVKPKAPSRGPASPKRSASKAAAPGKRGSGSKR